jgi:ribosomal-protein-alanine N-acetyltransferase
MILAGADKAGDLAAIHAAAFDHPWDHEALTQFLLDPGVFALTDLDALGFILIRVVADEGEVLTLAVTPYARRHGLARRLLNQAAATAAYLGAASLFLEVAADNAAALGLYHATGFEVVGRRAGYYARSTSPAIDALVLKKPLDAALGPPA